MRLSEQGLVRLCYEVIIAGGKVEFFFFSLLKIQVFIVGFWNYAKKTI